MSKQEKKNRYREKRKHSPWTVVGFGWVMLVFLTLLTSHRLYADTVAALEADEETNWKVESLDSLSQVGRSMGLTGAFDWVRHHRDDVYEANVRWGEVEEPPLRPRPRPGSGAELAQSFWDRDSEPGEGTGEAAPADDPGEPAEPAEPADTRFRPTRILMVGASSMQFALGNALENELEQYANLELHRFGRHSSGLSRPDYFDWIEKSEELIEEFHPDLVIAQFGGNDCQGLANHAGRGVGRLGTEDWDFGYFTRVQHFISVYTDEGIGVVMLGMPIMRSPTFRRRIVHMNEITQAAAEGYVDKTDAPVFFLSLHEMSATEDNEFQAEIEYEGRTRRYREEDGTHFTRFGATLAAAELAVMLEELFILERLPAPEEGE